MSNYSDKLAHIQVVINCLYSVAQMCTREDTLAHNFGAPCLGDVMSYNSLTTQLTRGYKLKRNNALHFCGLTLVHFRVYRVRALYRVTWT